MQSFALKIQGLFQLESPNLEIRVRAITMDNESFLPSKFRQHDLTATLYLKHEFNSLLCFLNPTSTICSVLFAPIAYTLFWQFSFHHWFISVGSPKSHKSSLTVKIAANQVNLGNWGHKWPECLVHCSLMCFQVFVCCTAGIIKIQMLAGI